jgi:Family of unknown function (DUF5924)/Protein of unknown function (DUF2914)
VWCAAESGPLRQTIPIPRATETSDRAVRLGSARRAVAVGGASLVQMFMRLQKRLRRSARWFGRFPWLLPLVSFVAGLISFVAVRRGADFGRVMALLALLGWPWLLVEPVVRRVLERRKRRLGNLVVNFVSQSLQQELLFFSLPFLIGATQLDTGQIAFTSIVGALALISTVDPVYERFVATRAARRLMFHAFCSWIAALVVLPMVLHLPLERALPVSLLAMAAWLILTLPLSLHSLKTWAGKTVWVACVLVVPVALWALRGQIPAAGFAVTKARITQSVVDHEPGPAVVELTPEQLADGVVAYAAIRAPAGLTQSVVFEWRHGRETERIVSAIAVGTKSGYRNYSRKQAFPADPLGRWTVDVLTPQGQLLKRLKFAVVNPDSAGDAAPHS